MVEILCDIGLVTQSLALTMFAGYFSKIFAPAHNLGAFAFSDNNLKNEKNVVFNLELLAFCYQSALILLNNKMGNP